MLRSLVKCRDFCILLFLITFQGVCWVDMHKLAERNILEGLIAAGILQGNVDEMMEARIGR